MGAMSSPLEMAQFLAWEERQELRHEFDGIAAKAMTGGTGAHVAIEARLIATLLAKLAGKPCRPYGSNLRLKLARSVRYADASVVCAPVGPEETFATAPVVIFEILSKGTSNEDVVVKNAEYQATPSVQRYVILQQTHRAAIVFSRAPEGWSTEFVSGKEAMLDMPEIGIALSLAEIYEGVTLRSDLPDPA